ncbi:MAG: MOSC N-terminal beta barrel domain-containing protein [Aigarchaeota archaeon]|nr:MOSC N-terminal beta barrel domain-containing protein [Candidatus Pelearchaeum maunauluense]
MSGEVVGRVAELWRYPVKSMSGESLEELYVDKHGVVGDRVYAVFDEEMGGIASAKNPTAYGILLSCSARYVGEPLQSDPPQVAITLPDGYEVETMSGAARRLSQLLGRRARLINSRGGEPYHDSTHIHLITTKSLSMLNTNLPSTGVDRRRFKPNIVVENEQELEELSWVGGNLRIGGQSFMSRSHASAA